MTEKRHVHQLFLGDFDGEQTFSLKPPPNSPITIQRRSSLEKGLLAVSGSNEPMRI